MVEVIVSLLRISLEGVSCFSPLFQSAIKFYNMEGVQVPRFLGNMTRGDVFCQKEVTCFLGCCAKTIKDVPFYFLFLENSQLQGGNRNSMSSLHPVVDYLFSYTSTPCHV